MPAASVSRSVLSHNAPSLPWSAAACRRLSVAARTARVLQREAPPRLFTPPKNRRHSEERPWRRRISSMLQHPGHHDEAALDVMSRAIHHWMRFFARLRMTANAVCSVPFVRVAAERSASPSLLVLPTEPFFAVILRSEATKDLLLARSPPAFAVDRQTRLR
jgi:hypothetical protein